MLVKPAPHALEVRFTFNLLTVTKCIQVDGDGDEMLTVAELMAAQPAFTKYLNEHVKLKVNQTPTLWGEKAEYHYLWPRLNATPPLGEDEYSGRHMDVTFVLPQSTLIKDVGILFEVFEQTGPRQTILGKYEQDGQVKEVLFSPENPEQTHVTGHVEEPDRNTELSPNVSQPAEIQTGQNHEMKVTGLAGVALLAAVLLLFGYRWVRRSKR